MILLSILITGYLPFESVAEHREYETDEFEQKIIIPTSSLKTIDLDFKSGEELEFVYALRVKEDLPIDVWFVNDENYNRYVGGGEFLFYIDGSGQQIIFTKKIVSVTEYDIYQLILANYNNQSVEVNIAYETRTYYAVSDEDTSEDFPIFMYSLIIVVIILTILLGVFVFKSYKYKHEAKSEIATKTPSKKSKNRKAIKEAKPSKKEVKPSKKQKSQKPPKEDVKHLKKTRRRKPFKEETKPKIPAKSAPESPRFCGYCGRSVDTPYCRHCGREV